jgi:hypothetical protein
MTRMTRKRRGWKSEDPVYFRVAWASIAELGSIRVFSCVSWLFPLHVRLKWSTTEMT